MEILYVLLVLLVITRAFGELAERLGQPALLGELLSGVGLGLLVSRYAATFPVLSGIEEDRVFRAITDLGIFFLMLLAGLDLRPGELASSARRGIPVAFGGLLLPLALGLALGWTVLPESPLKLGQTLFIGVALSITAVPVSARVLMDLGKLDSPIGRLIVSAAIFDDILSLVLLAALTSVIRTGTAPELSALAGLAGRIALFLGVTVLVAHYLLPALARRIRVLRIQEFEFSFLLIVGLAFAMFAEFAGLHFILGAFAAGLFFGRETVNAEVYEDLRAKVSTITVGFLAPVFFASIGLRFDPSVFTGAPFIALWLIGLATVGKLIGCGVPALASGLSLRSSTAVGVGMNARGAVELVIADIALQAGLFSQPEPPPAVVSHLFSAVVLMAIVTTIATPLGLRWIFRRR
jgi:Kef-type K+ transport system membrane component KefB